MLADHPLNNFLSKPGVHQVIHQVPLLARICNPGLACKSKIIITPMAT
jgi:hypothetical protein